MSNRKGLLQVSAFTILLQLCPGCLILGEFVSVAVLLTKLMTRMMLIPCQFPASHLHSLLRRTKSATGVLRLKPLNASHFQPNKRAEHHHPINRHQTLLSLWRESCLSDKHLKLTSFIFQVFLLIWHLHQEQDLVLY